MKYRIAWREPASGLKGHGEWCLNQRADAEALAMQYNRLAPWAVHVVEEEEGEPETLLTHDLLLLTVEVVEEILSSGRGE